MRRFRWLLLLGAVLLEVGCGLPDEYFLQPPTVSSQFALTQQNAQILGTSRGSDLDIEFLGYELYYKFYAPTDPASTLAADQGYGGPNNTVLDLQQHGFQRVTLGPGTASGPDTSPGYSSAPLVNVKSIDPVNYLTGGAPLTVSYAIDIAMNGTASTPPLNTFGFSTSAGALFSFFTYRPPYTPPAAPPPPSSGNEIRRFVQAYSYIDNGQKCAPFATNANFPTQSQHNYDDVGFAQVDVQALQPVWSTYVHGPPGDGTIYIMMYAVAYGIANNQSFQRSSPAYMGFTPIQVLN
jgi:hypothetical protein